MKREMKIRPAFAAFYAIAAFVVCFAAISVFFSAALSERVALTGIEFRRSLQLEAATYEAAVKSDLLERLGAGSDGVLNASPRNSVILRMNNFAVYNAAPANGESPYGSVNIPATFALPFGEVSGERLHFYSARTGSAWNACTLPTACRFSAEAQQFVRAGPVFSDENWQQTWSITRAKTVNDEFPRRFDCTFRYFMVPLTNLSLIGYSMGKFGTTRRTSKEWVDSSSLDSLFSRVNIPASKTTAGGADADRSLSVLAVMPPARAATHVAVSSPSAAYMPLHDAPKENFGARGWAWFWGQGVGYYTTRAMEVGMFFSFSVEEQNLEAKTMRSAAARPAKDYIDYPAGAASPVLRYFPRQRSVEVYPARWNKGYIVIEDVSGRAQVNIKPTNELNSCAVVVIGSVARDSSDIIKDRTAALTKTEVVFATSITLNYQLFCIKNCHVSANSVRLNGALWLDPQCTGNGANMSVCGSYAFCGDAGAPVAVRPTLVNEFSTESAVRNALRFLAPAQVVVGTYVDVQ
jgi:hypothetical protein